MDFRDSKTSDNPFTIWELSQLLAINKTITEAKTAVELLASIREKVMKLIPFDDTGILIIEKDGMYHYDIAVNIQGWDDSNGNKILQEQADLTRVKHHGSYLEDVIKRLEKSNSPIIEDWELAYAQWNHPFFPFVKNLGYKEALVAILKSNGETYGSLWLNSKRRGQYNPNQFALLEAISGQVSIAVANLLVNEEITQREREKSQLLEISGLIAQVKNSTDLLRLIIDKVKPIFNFHDCGLFVLSEDQTTHIDLATPDVSPSEWNSILAKKPREIKHDGSPVKMMMGEIAKKNTPLLYDFKTLVENFPSYPQIEGAGLLELGYRDCLAYNMTVRGKSIGMFCINALQKDFFDPKSFPIFQSVTESISIAIANILAQEELKNENRTKAILLEISEHIAAINNRKELFATIINEIKTIIPIDDTAILVLNKAGTHWQDWTNIDNYQETEVVNSLRQAGFTNYLAMDPLMELSFTATGILPIDEYIKANHPFAPIMADAGLKEFMFTPLISQGKTIGSLFFDSNEYGTYSSGHFETFKVIANMVASAVSNIIANEEILDREKEKDVLLTISQKLSKATEADEILQILINEVKPIFNFYDTGILVIDEQAKGVYDLSVVYPHIDNSEVNDFLNQKGYYNENQLLKLENSVVEWILHQFKNQKGPLIFDYLKDFSSYSDGLLLEDLKNGGYTSAWMCPLIQQGKTFGILSLNFIKNQAIPIEKQTLFLALADRIASSLANILAKEEILKREIEKSRLLKIAGAISRISNKQELLYAIYENIAPVFPFDSAGLFITDQEKDLIYEVLNSDAFPDELQRVLENSNNLGPWKLSNSNKDSWWMKDTIVLRSLEEEAELATGNIGEEQFKAGLAYGLKHFIGGPMYANGKKIGAICFNSKQDNFYTQEHLFMFQSLSEQISVAIANILANEDISRRAEEKALLLRLSTELSLRKSIHGVTALIFERIKTLINAEGIVLTLLSADKKSYKAVQHESSPDILAIYKADEQYNSNFNKNVAFHLDPFISGEAVFEKKFPYYTNVKDVLKRYPNHGWANLMQKAGTKSTTIYVLRLNDQPFGGMFWHWRDELKNPEEFYPIIQGVGDLVAITLSNLIANSELLEHAKQIESLNLRLEEQNAYLEEEILGKYNFGEIIGESPALKNIYHNIKLVSKTDTTVLITGETGTGKELIARAIHEASDRKGKTLIKLNCAALPAQLIESELFGHERGAFTGAIERRIGKFELAHDSTIFLDEVGELPLDLQSKLLRVLQEKELERLGGSKVIKTNVRVLSATNRDLQKEVQAGKFRSDLFYRLNVFPIHLPPLRERKEDIPPLVHHFLYKYQKKLGKKLVGVSNKVMTQLTSYSWPGNIRELDLLFQNKS